MKKVGKIGERNRAKRGLIVLFAVLAAVFFVLSSSRAKASDDHLVINEIYPTPISTCDQLLDPYCIKEWVELYNPTDFVIDLKDYSLKDGANTAKKISASSLLVQPQGYFTFENATGWLNGDSKGEIVFLLAGDTIIDKVAYGNWSEQVLDNNSDVNSSDNALVPFSGRSISRIPNGADTDNDKNDFQVVLVTKGSKNILPPPAFYPDDIIINEILPEPATTSNDEYVELFNKADEDINLEDWRISDLSGMEFYIPAGVISRAHEYLVFCKDSQSGFCDLNHKKFSLNDTGDTLFLIDPNGDTKYTIIYNKAKRGQSYSKFGNDWKWTLSQTPNTENIFLDEMADQDEEVDVNENIASARQKKNGDIVEIIGTVSVLPGTLSAQYFYIQDEAAGIQIYSSKKDFPTMQLGDQVSVTGEMSESNGERRVKISSKSDIQLLGHSQILSPKNLVIDQISEDDEGTFVKVKGTVTKTSGSTFYIHGSGEVQVIIRESTNIQKPKMKKGDVVEIAGIVSEYKGHFRILPTKQSDVIVLSSGTLPKAGPETFSLKYLTVIMVVWSSFLIRKRKLGNLPHGIQKI